jgi:hypothetical protein
MVLILVCAVPILHMATRSPHLHILLVDVLMGLAHRVLIGNDLWLLKVIVLFLLILLQRCLVPRVSIPDAGPGVEILLVALIVLEHA